MPITYRPATPQDLPACTDVRGRTRDNAFSRQQLEAIGVTEASWIPLLESGRYKGFVAMSGEELIGFSFGDTQTGEVLVVAVLDGFEGMGVGKTLLALICEVLFASGSAELWLAASATDVVRAYGFYRRLGWNPTGKLNDDGDEILTLSATRFEEMAQWRD